jgi:ribosomal protein L21E
MVRRFDRGDRVRVDIPDESDPDHDRLHGETGVVSEVQADAAEDYSGDSRDNHLFFIELDSGDTVTVRWRDLRPA